MGLLRAPSLKSKELKATWKRLLACSLEISHAAAKEAGKYAISIITGEKDKADDEKAMA